MRPVGSARSSNGSRFKRWSINAIARELTTAQGPEGRPIQKTVWHHHQVAEFLANRKYIGQWAWGATRTIRNSKGKVSRSRSMSTQGLRDRPNLRIVAQEVWELAQSRLGCLTKQFGMQPGQKRRGPRVHHSVEYPQGLLRGLVVCAVCKRRLWQEGRGGKYFLACPDHGDGSTASAQCGSRPCEAGRGRNRKHAGDLLENWPEWISRAIATMRATLERHFQAVPEQLAADKRSFWKWKKPSRCILKRLEDRHADQSEALNERLANVRRKRPTQRRRIDEAERAVIRGSAEMPSEDRGFANSSRIWVRCFVTTRPAAGRLLSRADRARSRHSAVVGPGQKRGFGTPQLPDRIVGHILLRGGSGERIPEALCARRIRRSREAVPEIVIDLGRPTRMEELAPKSPKCERRCHLDRDHRDHGFESRTAYETWKRYATR